MKQVLIQLDDQMAAQLERVVPSRSRQRSDFIRNAIREALWALEERQTEEAYRRQPDSETDDWFDARVWNAAPKASTSRPPSRKKR